MTDHKAANVARHQADNLKRAQDAADRKEVRRLRHVEHVESQRRGRAARQLEREYQRLLGRPVLSDEDGDEIMAARDAASNERAYINYF